MEVSSPTQAPVLAAPRRPTAGGAPPSSAWPETQAEALPIKQLRRAVDDLFAPRPVVYWLDFLVSVGCFCGGFALTATLPLGNLLKLAGAVVSVLALYRAVLAKLYPNRPIRRTITNTKERRSGTISTRRSPRCCRS